MSKRLIVYLLLSFLLIAGTATSATAQGGGNSAQSLPPTLPRFGVYVRDHTNLTGSILLKDAGAKWLEMRLLWSVVESQQGTYDWTAPDDYLSKAVNEGYNIILTVQSNPDWAADTPCGPINEENLTDFSNFLEAAVQRYAGPPYNIRMWAFYNEPDNADAVNYAWLGGCWGKGHPNSAQGAGGAAYARLMQIAFETVKHNQPDALVLMGGLAYDNFITEGGTFDPSFLDEFLYAELPGAQSTQAQANKGCDYFDMINFHYFPAWSYRWDTGNPYTSSIIGKANWLLQEVFQCTGRMLPILTTEVGQPSGGAIRSSDTDPYGEEIMARRVVQLFARSMAANLYPVIWFEAVDAPDSDLKYGLLREDLTPKPAYYAYRTFTTELGAATYLHTLDEESSNDAVEGYVMSLLGHRKYALWSRSETATTHTFTFTAPNPKLRVVQKDGTETIVPDGGAGDLDGQANGSITLSVGPSPIIVEDLTLDQRLFTPAILKH